MAKRTSEEVVIGALIRVFNDRKEHTIREASVAVVEALELNRLIRKERA